MKLASKRFALAASGLFLVLPFFVARAGEVETLLQIAEASRSTNPAEFASALDGLQALRSSAKPAQLRQLRLLLAYQHVMKGRYQQAIRDALAVYAEAPEVAIKFRAGLLVANTAAITREFSLGLRHLESALEMQELIGDVDLRQAGLGVAGLLYNQFGQFALGQHYADQMLTLDLSPRNRCYARQLRFEALNGLGGELAEPEIVAAIADCDAQREPMASNLLRGYLARSWVKKGRVEPAIELLEKHLQDTEATGYPRLIGEVHGLLAEYRLMVNDVDGAAQNAQAALEKGGKDNYSLPLVVAHKVLYEVALRRNDLAAALSEYRNYAEADKARLDEIKAREFAFQLSRHELQQKNQAIELLKQQNEVLRLEQQVSKTSAQNTQLLLSLLALVLAAIGYWVYKLKRVQALFRHQAQIDGLTAISNRAHFREQAEAALAQCASADKPAALVLLDLDFFKQVNDRHGHARGDWVLQQVAMACRSVCREGDLCGRLGGEEFAILSVRGGMAAAERIAQQARERLALIDASDLDAPVTASFGCTSTTESGHVFEQMCAHADAAMYRAKAAGRDQVCRYGEATAAPVLELVRG